MKIRSFILVSSLSILLLPSCVSKKKYLTLKREAALCTREYGDELDQTKHRADSLQLVIVQKDSLIDSLSWKLTEAGKKERSRSAPVAGRRSTLSREQEYEKKALFIYNFTKFIEWPVEYNGTEFVIGVAGDDAVVKQIGDFMNDKKTFGKKIVVKPYKKGPRYNIVYVTSSKNGTVTAIRNDNRHNKTVLISDEENAGAAHISFSIDDDKIRYTASKVSIEKLGLKVAQELMRYSG